VPEEAGLTVRTANRYEELAAPNAQLASALSPPERLQGAVHRVLFHDMHRDAFIAKRTEVQRTVEQLLAELQASEHDKFAAHLYRSRREYRSACERSGKSGKPIERLRHLDVSRGREHGLPRRVSPMGTPVPDWRLRFLLSSGFVGVPIRRIPCE
jgi:hypothetical protein